MEFRRWLEKLYELFKEHLQEDNPKLTSATVDRILEVTNITVLEGLYLKAHGTDLLTEEECNALLLSLNGHGGELTKPLEEYSEHTVRLFNVLLVLKKIHIDSYTALLYLITCGSNSR